jgi:hypothetical protein
LYNGTVEKYNREKYYNEEVRNKFNELDKIVRNILPSIVDTGLRKTLEEKLQILEEIIFGYASGADTITYRLK